MNINKFSTYAITFRPRNGVTDEQVINFVAFIKKTCTYYYVITEKLNDERHIHSAIVMKQPTARSNLCQRLKQLFKSLQPEEYAVMYKGVKILYSIDFIQHYMDKGDDTVVIEKNLPELSCLEAFFPEKPESTGTVRQLAYHAEMHRLESLWHQYVQPHVEVNTSNARDFLFRMQYDERTIGLMEDRRMFQTSRWLVRWMNRVDSCKLELPPFEKEEGPGFH